MTNTENSKPDMSSDESDTPCEGAMVPIREKGEHPRRTASEIELWFVDYLAKLQELSPETIDVTVPFQNFALDSVTALGMTGDLEEWLGQSVDPTMVYDYPTIERFSLYLAEQDGT